MFMKIGEGGLGMGEATGREAAAWIGAWEGGLHKVVQAMGISSFTEWLETWPAWLQAIRAGDAALTRLTGQAPSANRWVDRLLNGACAPAEDLCYGGSEPSDAPAGRGLG